MEKHDCDRNTKMSAGLMSCVRENSPTLDENGDVATSSGASEGPEPQKRRKFQPFRNLRRIFRRRTVSNADTNPTASPSPTVAGTNPTKPPTSSEHFGTLDSSTTDTTLSSTKSGPSSVNPATNLSVPASVLQNNLRNEIKMRLRADHLMDSDREINEYPRSLSEGRLMDSDISRDGLSQSHDSVFSESATASSLSIVLKNELADVLRKRRNHRPETSDEDLGLPQSPITPQRKDRSMHHSEGSLSLLSGTSSDMDDEHSSGAGSGSGLLDISTSSSYFNKSDQSRNSDEVDLDMTTTPTLSHSAARHKLAVRPKKKGPTRNRRSRESALLPSTPEVNEESLKHSTTDVTDASQTKLKSKSLPHGVNPSAMEIHSAPEPKTTTVNSVVTKTNIVKTEPATPVSTATTTSIYVNKSISKSYDFSKSEKKVETPTITVVPPKPQPTPAAPEKEKEKEKGDGLLKRFLNRSIKKKKAPTEPQQVSTEDDDDGGFLEHNKMKIEQVTIDNHFENKPTFKTNPLFVSTSPESSMADSDSSGAQKKLKSGPASRQRIIPKDIETVVVPMKQDRGDHSGGTTTIMIKTPDYVKEELKTPAMVTPTVMIFPKPKDLQTQHSDEPRITVSFQAKSEEHLSTPKRSVSNDDSLASQVTPTKIQQFRTPKIYNLSPYQQKVSKTEINFAERSAAATPKRVEKSKSFRIYPENTQQISNNLGTAINLPSLPNLVSKDDDYINDEFAIASKFKREFVKVEHVIKPPHQIAPQKFEITDNNLLKPKETESHIQQPHNVKSVLVTNNPGVTGERSPCASSQNISQIEENIDKLVKSASFVTVLKASEDLTEMEPPKIADKPAMVSKLPEFMKVQLNRVDSNRMKSHVVLSTRTDPVSPGSPVTKVDVTKSFTKRMSCEILEPVLVVEAAKPPLPPTVNNRHSFYKSATEDMAPTSPVRKTQTPVVMERKLSNHSITSDSSSKRSSYSSQENLDDSKVLLRRTSVSEERLRYERKSSAPDSTSERKKSVCDDLDDTVVVMRKKSISDLDTTTTRSKDDTPELMKVFARRSLKVRGEDEHKLQEELDKMHIKQSNIDSDKENQSSEEKLDKLPKVEIKIVNKDPPREPPKNNNVVPTIKPFGTPNKFGNSANNTTYRNSTSFIENLRNQSNNKLLNDANTNSTNLTAISNSNSNLNNNNNNSISISSNLIKTLSNNSININSSHNQNIANNNVNINVSAPNNRHTISIIKDKQPAIGEDTASIEFKGILQRRAEWEKRAKGEAFK